MKCHCGKICKNIKGLRIHQAKTTCKRVLTEQRARQPLGETQKDSSPEKHHSTDDLNASVPSPSRSQLATPSQSAEAADLDETDPSPQADQVDVTLRPPRAHERKERLQWPKATEVNVWQDFEHEVDLILESTLLGPAERKLKSMSHLIYSIGKERFGVQKKKTNCNQPQPNRREKRIKQIREELKKLKKAFKKANQEERVGLKELRDIQRRELASLKRAENLRMKSRKKAKTRAAFVANPYKFSKQILDKERTGSVTNSLDEVQNYLRTVHSDPERHVPLGECKRIEAEPPPTTQFDESEPKLSEVKETLKKARNSSAPGPNGIPYRVYKMCPRLTRRLWLLLKAIWRKEKVPEEWQLAEGIFTPKEKDSKDISQFRTISLLNVEGKIFFSILAKRLTSYLLKNNYVDTSVQKGGVPGFSGCIEHTSAISQLIREARVNKRDLTVVWLDLANAYGTIPHQLIEESLEHYHVPESIQKVLKSYLRNINLRFALNENVTDWQRLEKGIVTGCTVSVALFIMGMNMIIKAADRETRGPLTEAGVRLPPNRGFMDDLTITTETHVQARWILTALEEAATWARMQFKPRKSRYLVIKKGISTERFVLTIQGDNIPAIQDNPIKCLGKWYDSSLNDHKNISRVKVQLHLGLKQINKSGLPGKFKAWLFQHGLLPRIMWPLMLYEIPTTTVEGLERVISKQLRRWLGVPPSFSSVGLYGTSNQLQLPISSLVEEFKVAKTRFVVTLKQSKDSKIRNAGIEIRTGRKWSASQAVAQAESQLKLKDVMGTTQVGRQGLGITKRKQWSTANDQEKRSMIQEEIRYMEEEGRKAKAVAMGSQGAWTKWATTNRKLTWKDIWNYQPLRLSFLLRSVYDVLPSPTNLHRWGLTEQPNCPICGGIGTLEHILSTCQTSLTQGRYRWRHDAVLGDLASILEPEINKKRLKSRTRINFVKAGQTVNSHSSATKSILDEASEWTLAVDLKKRLVFPGPVQTTLRPDIVLSSNKDKSIVMIELTVPWETRCEEANERKRAKYSDLQAECKAKGWKCWLFPVEIGVRGFPAPSMGKMLSALGVRGGVRRHAVGKVGLAAERASSWLWLRRTEPTWTPGTQN